MQDQRTRSEKSFANCCWWIRRHTRRYIIRVKNTLGLKTMSVQSVLSLFGTAVIIMSAIPAAFAQTNSITVPISKGDLPKIDGAWNSPDEWKQASVTFVNFTDGTELVIKAKHDINSLYVLLEMPKDARMDGHGVVCLDTLNDGGYYMETDDFCFTLGNLVRVYQGNGKTTVMMHEIPVSRDLQAARA